jgi:hypothetical protein
VKRVLLVQPSMQPPGGGNGVAAWVLQALAAEHRVTVLSWRPVEIAPINRFFGTHLRHADFDTIEVPRSWRAAADRLPTPSSLIKLSLFMRYTRKISSGFDVVFGVHNETDYGRRGIQYVHYPTYLRPRPRVDFRWYHRPRAGLSLYYALADRIADFSIGPASVSRRFLAYRRGRCIHPWSIRRPHVRGVNATIPFLRSAASRRKRNTSAS